MDFLTALTCGPFWYYNAAALALLALQAGILILNQRKGQRLEEFRPVFWSWVFLVGIAIPAVLLGHETFVLVVALLALFASKEFARATGLYGDWIFTGLVYLGILAVNLVAMWAARQGESWRGWGYEAFMAAPIYGVALLCLVPVFRNRADGMLQRVALAVMAFVYFGYFLAHLSLLAGIPKREVNGVEQREVYSYVFFMLYGTASADLVGWLAHRKIGKHPLAGRIAPEPSWESVAASLAWSCLWCFAWQFTLPATFGWPALLIAAGLFGIMGPLGDLVMRYVLTDLGLKSQAEESQYAPFRALGHLNRLIFVAPLFFRLVHFFDPQVLKP